MAIDNKCANGHEHLQGSEAAFNDFQCKFITGSAHGAHVPLGGLASNAPVPTNALMPTNGPMHTGNPGPGRRRILAGPWRKEEEKRKKRKKRKNKQNIKKTKQKK